ncbi:protoporphyrinogen oxidase HemJ [Jannaschia sp. M317]|uniref:protoporphyrinogen oxidase HemJ n=1 Tax=Jannaschia sp. M317 TaxID=2867011 RepID=UPI0021A261DE|nr:protoporphyrinogen oxidase HemJ [Jannaschia sp. M317]UWQ18320.1 protoporphyrinogen oxidase HemJ [Jannaschia sp. M317]
MGDLYLWAKALHVISVIAWMAGIFYLPRLFVYHVEQRKTVPEMMPVLEIMERRLLKAIMTPAMISTWLFGLIMVGMGGVDWGTGWAWIKAACVIGMTVFHMWCAGERKALAAGASDRTGRGFRMMNEVPTVLMILIVVSVIVKPF